MPVLEAMACNIPFVAPNHSAFEEHLSIDRGYLFKNAYQYIDVYGNENRYFADVDAGATALNCALNADDTRIVENAREYVSKRSWTEVGDIIWQALTS
jgi:glycosyltransferase involved in cell wall biosynthesis